MSSSLGFVVLARRPNQPDEIVSAVFPAYPNGMEQAQNVLESCWKRNANRSINDLDDFDVTYCIGEISERTP